MSILAKTISWIFLPLSAPVVALAIGLFLPAISQGTFTGNSLFELNIEAKYFLLYIFFAFSVVFPGLILVYLRFNGMISSFTVQERKERLLPALFVNGAALALYISLLLKDPNHYLPGSIYALALGSFIAVFLSTMITFFWKISLHGLGMGIITGFVFTYFSEQAFFLTWILPAVLITSGIVLSARMYLNAHSLSQSLSGFLLGAVAVGATVLIY